MVRRVALAIAAAHLAGGRDLVMPQTAGRLLEIERFEAVAREAGAEFHEIVLFGDKREAVDRFADRTIQRAWDVHSREVVAAAGGDVWLSRQVRPRTGLRIKECQLCGHRIAKGIPPNTGEAPRP